jgi:acetyltransferase-like isoleucine patch superfamily enzyme
MQLGGCFLTEEDLGDVGFRKLGRNVKINERASIYGLENISIGSNVRIDDFAIIVATGPLDIGSYVHIAGFCFLGSKYGIVLEDYAGLAHGAKIYSASDDYSGEKMTNPTVPREFTGGKQGKVTLCRHVIIGAGSVVLPGCTLGEGVAVGACSVVKEDLLPWGVYAGIPVRFIGERKKDLLKLEQELSVMQVVR